MLPASQPVITQLTIDATPATSGAAQYSDAMTKAEAATNKLLAANDNLQKLLNQQGQQMQLVASANDNIAKSSDAVGKSLSNSGEEFLKTVEHLKLLATAAYLVSPALREIVNEDVGKAIGLIEPKALAAAKAISTGLAPAIGVDLVQSLELSLPLVKAVASTLWTAMAPVVTFFAQITAPIAAAVLVWKGLVYVWQQGADLLDKYANFNRNNFTPAGGEQALAEATKFQQSDLTADQIARATDLGSRLDDANRKIADFFKVHIDVTNLALGLQSIWVKIVEAIASAVSKLDAFLNHIPDWLPKVIGIMSSNLPIIGGAITAGRVVSSAAGVGTGSDPDAAMRAARSTLAAGLAAKYPTGPLGSSFHGRWWDDVLAKPDTSTHSANGYDIAVKGVEDQIAQLQLEKDGASKTSQAVEELKVQHTLMAAAMKAGITVTDEMKAKWKDYGDQIAALNIQIKQQQVLQSEQFKGATQFMSPAEQAQAAAARTIDPTDWRAHLQDAGPQLAKLNSELAQGKDLALGFFQSFNSDLINGTVNVQTLTKALQGLEGKLLDLVENQALNALFGAVGADGKGGGLFANFFKSIFGSANGNVFAGGSPLLAFAAGGIVGSPTVFPMANGGVGLMGEAGPEAIMPLRRGPDGRLGVAGAGGGTQVNVVVNNSSSGATADVQHRKNSDGSVDIVATVKDIVNEHLAGGGGDKIMRGRYGVPVRARPR